MIAVAATSAGRNLVVSLLLVLVLLLLLLLQNRIKDQKSISKERRIKNHMGQF
jgi:hypothetical protein